MTTATKNGLPAAHAWNAGEAETKKNGGLVRVRVHLHHETPLLMNAMSQEQLLAIRDRVKGSKTAAKPTVKEEAGSKVYRLADGRPCMPTKNLYSCFIGAGQYVRLDGKRQVSTAKSTVLPGMLCIEDVELPLFHPQSDDAADWQVDLQQGRNPNGGEAVCIVRPRFDQWEIRCVLEIDQEQMPLSMAANLVAIAGRRMGLGDGRPQRKLTFGRFRVSRWEVLG